MSRKGTTLKFTGKAAQQVFDALTKEPQFLILHKQLVDGRAMWWRPNRAGYTTDLNAAGRYTKAEAESIARIRGDDFPVPESAFGTCLTVRRVVSVEDGLNFDEIKRFMGRQVNTASKAGGEHV